jgi:hypothetical protein
MPRSRHDTRFNMLRFTITFLVLILVYSSACAVSVLYLFLLSNRSILLTSGLIFFGFAAALSVYVFVVRLDLLFLFFHSPIIESLISVSSRRIIGYRFFENVS